MKQRFAFAILALAAILSSCVPDMYSGKTQELNVMRMPPRYICCQEILVNASSDLSSEINTNPDESYCCAYMKDPAACNKCIIEAQSTASRPKPGNNHNAPPINLILLGFLALIPVLFLISVINLIMHIANGKGFLPKPVSIALWVILGTMVICIFVLIFVGLSYTRIGVSPA